MTTQSTILNISMIRLRANHSLAAAAKTGKRELMDTCRGKLTHMTMAANYPCMTTTISMVATLRLERAARRVGSIRRLQQRLMQTAAILATQAIAQATIRVLVLFQAHLQWHTNQISKVASLAAYSGHLSGCKFLNTIIRRL